MYFRYTYKTNVLKIGFIENDIGCPKKLSFGIFSNIKTTQDENFFNSRNYIQSAISEQVL